MSKRKKNGARPQEAPGAEPPKPAGKGTRKANAAGREQRRGPRQPRDYPDPVDDALDDTFPASDPPSWMGR